MGQPLLNLSHFSDWHFFRWYSAKPRLARLYHLSHLYHLKNRMNENGEKGVKRQRLKGREKKGNGLARKIPKHKQHTKLKQ
ncbi:hypothetical protein ABT90_03485 [Salmonella enterica subsp. enterica serovar Typhimurium]|nr:hypothetical protein ABT90_03485 [Salmonella enterica subsp. enterica serovar Typhimurium]